MTLRVTNATFESTSTGDFDSLDDAYRAVIASGLGIAADEVSKGASSTIVHIAVDCEAHRDAARGAVAVSTARVMGEAAPE